MKLINIGYNNMVNQERVIAVITPESAPSKRLIQDAKEHGRAIDCTSGRKTRSIIITDSDHVLLSAIQSETVSARLNGSLDDNDSKAEDTL